MDSKKKKKEKKLRYKENKAKRKKEEEKLQVTESRIDKELEKVNKQTAKQEPAMTQNPIIEPIERYSMVASIIEPTDETIG